MKYILNNGLKIKIKQRCQKHYKEYNVKRK